MNINPESKVGQIAAEHPPATRVFARHGIDFCCCGGKPLGEACTGLGLETAVVLAEIQNELTAQGRSEVRWDQAPLGDLIAEPRRWVGWPIAIDHHNLKPW